MYSLPAKLATAAVIALLGLVLIAATTSALTHTLAAAARPTPTPPSEPATPPPAAPVTPTPSDPGQPAPTQPSPPASPPRPAGSVADIPAALLPLYRHAASTCPGLWWTVLAAIGKVESDHGRSTLPGVSSGSNTSGASGIMQFLPATFAAYARNLPPGGARPPSPFNPSDAIHTAANFSDRSFGCS